MTDARRLELAEYKEEVRKFLERCRELNKVYTTLNLEAWDQPDFDYIHETRNKLNEMAENVTLLEVEHRVILDELGGPVRIYQLG